MHAHYHQKASQTQFSRDTNLGSGNPTPGFVAAEALIQNLNSPSTLYPGSKIESQWSLASRTNVAAEVLHKVPDYEGNALTEMEKAPGEVKRLHMVA